MYRMNLFLYMIFLKNHFESSYLQTRQIYHCVGKSRSWVQAVFNSTGQVESITDKQNISDHFHCDEMFLEMILNLHYVALWWYN